MEKRFTGMFGSFEWFLYDDRFVDNGKTVYFDEFDEMSFISKGGVLYISIYVKGDFYGLVIPSWSKDKDSTIEFLKSKRPDLVDRVAPRVQYEGGNPSLITSMSMRAIVNSDSISFLPLFIPEANKGLGTTTTTIPYSTISNIQVESQQEIERRITATRLLALGVFAFAVKKKEIHVSEYLTIDVKDENDLEFTMVFSGTQIRELLRDVFEKLSLFRKDHPKIDEDKVEKPSSKSIPEQLKEYKELLDLGILTNEEFDKKKKELLG